MNNEFKNIWVSDRAFEITDGIYYFGDDDKGDQFSDEDFEYFKKSKRMENKWNNRYDNVNSNAIEKHLCQKVVEYGQPFMEVACGPGFGLISNILSLQPNLPCLATDACSRIINTWHEVLKDDESATNISFASFDATNMPILSDSIDAVTSYIGISSIRTSGVDGMDGVNEIVRVLKHGGYIFAIENEWKNRDAINEVFRIWQRTPWKGFDFPSWEERFHKANLITEHQEIAFIRKLTKGDNELGEKAHEYGIDINLEFTAYILHKK